MKSNLKDNIEFDLVLDEDVPVTSPLKMQYLGSKGRLSTWILAIIKDSFPNVDGFFDLFAGTGSVAWEASRFGYNLRANDIQPYSYVILRALFAENKDGLIALREQVKDLYSLDKLHTKNRSSWKKYWDIELGFFKDFEAGCFNWVKYKNFCDDSIVFSDSLVENKGRDQYNLFSNYFSNTYFGVNQCLQIDSLKELVAEADLGIKYNLDAALISFLTYAVSSTTHLAQYLKPNSEKTAINLLKRRSIDILANVSERIEALAELKPITTLENITNLDFRVALLERIPNDNWVVYVDPPYFKEHYSRYYHVLDTCHLYDYPKISVNRQTGLPTVGRYREGRIISDFGLRASVEKAFKDLFNICSKFNTNIAISYAETSLVKKDVIIRLGKEEGFECEVHEKNLMHSGQGQPRNKIVKEYLFVFKKG